MVRAWAAWLGVAVMVLAGGCAGPAESPAAPRPTLLFPSAMDVETTPDEPFEARGALRVAFADGVLAIDSALEPDLYHHTVVTETEAYVSQEGRAWVRYDLDEAMAKGRLSTRLLVWDLPRLLADPALDAAVQEDGSVVLDGTAERAGRTFTVHATFRVAAGRVQEVVLDTEQAREAPFTFRPTTSGPATAIPSPSYSETEILGMDQEAREGHGLILGLVEDYRDNHAGTLPETLDAATLRLELLQAGAEWPDSPYDGEPMRHSDRSGHFLWKRCSLTEGLYTGLGGDGPLLTKTFGSCS